MLIEANEEYALFDDLPLKPPLPEILKDISGKSVMDDELYKAYKNYERQYDKHYGAFIELAEKFTNLARINVSVHYDEDYYVLSKGELSENSSIYQKLRKQLKPDDYDIEIEMDLFQENLGDKLVLYK